MLDGARLLAYRAVGRLPGALRARLMRAATPTYTVGASCRILDDQGRLLLVQAVYRDYWTLPGGFTNRGEDPAAAAVRETFEETGVRPEVTGEPVVVVDPDPRRIEFVFPARLPAGEDPAGRSSPSAEISHVGWFEHGTKARDDARSVDLDDGPTLLVRWDPQS